MVFFKKFAKGTFYLFIGSTIGRVGLFFSSIILARFLGAHNLGNYSVIQATVGLFTIFSLFGLDATSAKYIAEFDSKDREFIGRFITTITLLGVGLIFLVSTVYIFSVRYLAVGIYKNPDLIPLFYIAIIWLTGQTFLPISEGILLGFRSFNAYAKAKAISGLAVLPVTFLLVYFYGLNGAVYAGIILYFLSLVLVMHPIAGIIIREKIPCWKSLLDKKDFYKVLNFALPSFLLTFLVVPITWFGVMLLSRQTGGLDALGFLKVAGFLSGIALYLPSLFQKTSLPLLSEVYGTESSFLFGEAAYVNLRIVWLITLPIIFLLMCSSRLLLHIFYGAGFEAAWPIACLLLVHALFFAVGSINDQILAGAGRRWITFFNHIIWAIIFFIVAVILIPKYLAIGNALTNLISVFIYFILQVFWLKKLFNIGYENFTSLFIFSIFLFVIAFSFAFQFQQQVVLIPITVLSAAAVAYIEWRFFLTEAEKRLAKASTGKVKAAILNLKSRL